MADYTVNIDLEPVKRGDKWVGIPVIGPVLINSAQPADTLARIKMHFLHPSGLVFKLDSDSTAERDGPITISDDETWEASIPETQGFLPLAGDWTWDMEFYATGDSNPLTLYKGVITAYADTTR